MTVPTAGADLRRMTGWALPLAVLAAGALSAGCKGRGSPPAQPTAAAAPAVADDPPAVETRPPIDPERLSRAIDSSAGYLVRNLRATGRFVYLRHLDENRDYGRKYNMVRHAGAMYALASCHERRPDKQVAGALVLSAGYLRSQIGPVPGAKGALAVWSNPRELGLRNASPTAKLGATGLGLVALVGVEKSAAGTTPIAELRSLGRFIIFMQRADGSFRSKYYRRAAGGGRFDSWVSLYYPGEAILGLLALYELDPDARWLDAAARGLACLAESRRGGEKIPPDHWALIATARLLPMYEKLRDPPISREAILGHAVQLCRRLLGQQNVDASDRVRFGSFGPTATTSSTATCMEGLLSALEFLPDERKVLRSEIRRAVRRGMAFVLRLQVTGGEFAGAIPRAAAPKSFGRDRRRFNRRVREVRIDYVQHALSAMMQYEALKN